VLGDRLACAAYLAKRDDTGAGDEKWRIKFSKRQSAALHLIGRLGVDHKTVIDYFVVPSEAVRGFPGRVSHRNSSSVDRFRFPNLEALTRRLAILGSSTADRHGRP
jgi:hypothetical protein